MYIHAAHTAPSNQFNRQLNPQSIHVYTPTQYTHSVSTCSPYEKKNLSTAELCSRRSTCARTCIARERAGCARARCISNFPTRIRRCVYIYRYVGGGGCAAAAVEESERRSCAMACNAFQINNMQTIRERAAIVSLSILSRLFAKRGFLKALAMV